MLFVASLTSAQHTVQSVKVNDLEWQKCSYPIETNYTDRVISIRTILHQDYKFTSIKSYPLHVEGDAINEHDERAHITMYFFKEYSYLVIKLDNGLIIKYLIN